MALSYFDKAVIFLLPILVLQLFKDQTVYLSIEYIYSITIVIIPFLDLGLAGYFYYVYRNKEDKEAIINRVVKIFHLLYFGLFTLGAGLIVCHYFIFPFEDYIVYIVSRALFLCTFAFLSSYYRLLNKPQNGLFVTISANIISLLVLFIYVFLEMEFELWLIFIGQILFCVIYFIKIVINLISKWHQQYHELQIAKLIKASLVFSWPTILQVFIMMYIANYGKINALDKMSLDDGTLLSLVQRFCMLIQLTHTSVLAFIIKDIYVVGDDKEIKKSNLYKYLFLITASTAAVLCLIFGYFSFYDYNFENFVFVVASIITYTYFWCIVSYLEIYYSRENKNIIKLYLACFNGLIFISVLLIDSLGYLEKITTAMFLSTFITMIVSLIILKRSKYYLS